MMVNRSIPRSTVIPEVPYPDIGQAIDWLCEAFGFTLRLRIADHRAQLNVGEGAVVLIEGDPDTPARCSVLVRLDDVNAHHEHARQSGARILRPPTDYPYGERQYSVEDFAGNRWTFSQSIADVDPADWGGTPGLL
jgi:uncharacterized glyoxalase superfamily protein PhnB